MKQEDVLNKMSSQLCFEIIKAFGFPKTDNWYGRLKPILSRATDNFSRIALIFDKLIAERDISEAARWSISNWCKGILARGCESVPREGPLLVVSNHPGAYDALVIAACLPRPDLHLVISDFPFLRYLENLGNRICSIPINKTDIHNRMAGMISAIHHLKNGGAVLLMGSGTIEPDPAVSPGALQYIQRWTNAVNLFFRTVPDTQVVLAAVSHILTTKWARHPLTWFQNGGYGETTLGGIWPGFTTIILSRKCLRNTQVEPCSRTNFWKYRPSSVRDILLEQESSLLIDHCNEFGGNPY